MTDSSYSTVSSRAQKLLKPGMAYTFEVNRAKANQFHPETNPTGSILMGVAENKLCSSMMLDKLRSFDCFTKDMLNYTLSTGQLALRQTLADFMSTYVFQGHSIDPNYLTVTPGCVAALVQLSLLLFEVNDAILIPTPMYPALIADFNNYGDVHTHHINGENHDEDRVFGYITAHALDAAYDEAVAAGHPPKAVLLCNPSNPLGILYSEEEIRLLIDWCRSRKVHLIADEIYALSTFGTPGVTSEDVLQNSFQNPFRSVAALVNNELGDYIHIAWSISKDFGASGVRVGVLYTQNKSLQQAVSNTNDATQVSNIAQDMVRYVLEDREFMEMYMETNRRRLRASYTLLKLSLEPLGVKVLPAVSGIFAYCDFRCFMPEETEEAEAKLFQDLTKRGMVFTPGHSCRCPVPGYFRVVYAYVQVAAIEEMARRLAVYREELNLGK